MLPLPVPEPGIECRGIDGKPGSFNVLIYGFEPVLLPRKEINGETKLTPHNLISVWYWAAGNPERPVRLRDLQSIFLKGKSFSPDIIKIFDSDNDGEISERELIIDTPEKEKSIQRS